MTEYVTKSGKVLTDDDIQRLADEAERDHWHDEYESARNALRSAREFMLSHNYRDALEVIDHALE